MQTASVDVPRSALGAYTPAAKTIAASLHALVARSASEVAPDLFAPANEPAELELKTSFVRLEPDSAEKPFAVAQVVIEVIRRSTGQVVYTRKAEAETRRLLQAPVPCDDA